MYYCFFVSHIFVKIRMLSQILILAIIIAISYSYLAINATFI